MTTLLRAFSYFYILYLFCLLGFPVSDFRFPVSVLSFFTLRTASSASFYFSLSTSALTYIIYPHFLLLYNLLLFTLLNSPVFYYFLFGFWAGFAGDAKMPLVGYYLVHPRGLEARETLSQTHTHTYMFLSVRVLYSRTGLIGYSLFSFHQSFIYFVLFSLYSARLSRSTGRFSPVTCRLFVHFVHFVYRASLLQIDLL